jgi:hypothetical protein
MTFVGCWHVYITQVSQARKWVTTNYVLTDAVSARNVLEGFVDMPSGKVEKTQNPKSFWQAQE